MFHDWIQTWFGWVQAGGYWGIVALMAMESSIFPVPSEVVMAPAAFWAAQGKLDFTGVVLAGTFGSWLGAAITYWAARALGLPAIHRFGKRLGLTPKKLRLAESWATEFGLPGVFFARLLPVVRHLISIPAGILGLNFWKFSVVTIGGAGLWCWILSEFGVRVLGDHPELLHSPEEMITVMKAKLMWFVGAVVLMGGLALTLKVWDRSRQSNRTTRAGR